MLLSVEQMRLLKPGMRVQLEGAGRGTVVADQVCAEGEALEEVDRAFDRHVSVQLDKLPFSAKQQVSSAHLSYPPYLGRQPAFAFALLIATITSRNSGKEVPQRKMYAARACGFD